MEVFQLANAQSGDVNLTYKGTPLHCSIDPQQEALREFQKLKNTGPSNIIIIAGLGLGYLLKRAFINSSSKILVYEPNKEILDFTLKAVDFSQEVNSGRVQFLSTIQEVSDFIIKSYSDGNEVSLIKLKSAEILYAEQIKELSLEIPKILGNLGSNTSTLAEHSLRWLAYGLYKLMDYKKASSISILEDKFKNKTALIVSAGPSLDENIELIKQNRDKFIIFCANVAYKSLMSNNIIPDFIMYIDATNHLETIKSCEHSQTNIINHFSCYQKLYEELTPKRFFTFYCKNDLLSRWIAKTADFSLESYETKGSVSHLALISAYNMGCNPIVLVGQDLAYSGGRQYSSGSFWDNKEKETQDSLTQVKGQNGEILQTSATYAGFIHHFEEFAQLYGKSVNLINCSTGGAQINGFENKSLADIAGNLDPLNLDMDEVLDNIIKTEPDPVVQNFENIRNGLRAFSQDLQKIHPLAEDGLRRARKLEQELKRHPINPSKIGPLASKIMHLFNEVDNNLFKKWDFSVYMLFKDLIAFHEELNKETADDMQLICDLGKVAKPFFFNLEERIRSINKTLLKEEKNL